MWAGMHSLATLAKNMPMGEEDEDEWQTALDKDLHSLMLCSLGKGKARALKKAEARARARPKAKKEIWQP